MQVALARLQKAPNSLKVSGWEGNRALFQQVLSPEPCCRPVDRCCPQLSFPLFLHVSRRVRSNRIEFFVELTEALTARVLQRSCKRPGRRSPSWMKRFGGSHGSVATLRRGHAQPTYTIW